MHRPLLLLAVLAFLAPVFPAAGQLPRVDPVLRAILQPEIGALLERPLDAPDDTASARPLGGLVAVDRAGPTSEPRVGMLIQLRTPDALDRLRAAGAQIGSVIGDIVTARIPLDAISELVDSPEFLRLEVARVNEIVHDSSMAAINAEALRSWNGTQWEGFAGQNVIVGVYDTGLDYRHQDFRDANDQTRLLGLWDQTLSGPRPPGFGYGYYCDPASLNAATCPERDNNGHGTHVAGTAAGDGTAGATGEPRYEGVAPRADLLIVKGGNSGFSEDRIIDGVNWIFQEATRLGKPAAVNLSLGGHFGPHDGTRLYEVAIDRLSGPGRVVAIAAGNEGANQVLPSVEPDFIHAMALPVEGRTDVFTLRVPSFDATPGNCENFALIDIWYEGTDRLDVTVVRPDGSSLTAPYGTSREINAPGGGILIYNAEPDENRPEGFEPLNNDNEAFIFINDCPESGLPQPGLWTIRITPTRVVSNQRYHMWIGASIFGGQPAFGVQGFDNSHSVSMPGTSNRAVTVGAFVTRRCWPTDAGTFCYNFQQPLGTIAVFSGIGPTRDGRLKPEITAPGFGVVSALSSASNPPDALIVDDGVHRINQGTSMAAPHVTGTIALMLQQDASLTPEEVKDALARSATRDRFTSVSFSGLPGDQGTPNFTWGYGKLNAFDALALVGNFSTLQVEVQGVAPPTAPLSEAGALIPLLRLTLDPEGERAVELTSLGFEVFGNDRDTARVVVYRDANGNGLVDSGEPLVGQSEPLSLPPGDTVAVTVPVSLRVESAEMVPLVVALKTSGAVPNAALFGARFNPQTSRGPALLVRAEGAEGTRFQPAVRTSVLAAEEVFALSENPVRSASVIFNFSAPPSTLSVYTLSGRRVIDLRDEIGNGRRIEWDLTNEEGNPIAPGVYLLVYQVGDQLGRQKLIVQRPAAGGRE